MLLPRPGRLLAAGLLLVGLGLPATAAAGPWLGGDGDAVADAPPATDADTEPDEPEAVDLQTLATALEDGMRRVVVDGADPLEALPVELADAPETTAAELRGLLTGADVRRVRLHAVEAHSVLWKASTPVHATGITWLPGTTSRLLSLREIPLSTPGLGAPPPSSTPPPGTLASGEPTLPGGLGRAWESAQSRLSKTLRSGRCTGLPVASDAALATVVPAPYLSSARQERDAAAAARTAWCEAARTLTWDRAQLRLQALHYNLYDESGTLKGGLLLRVDPSTGTFAYPLFKKTD